MRSEAEFDLDKAIEGWRERAATERPDAELDSEVSRLKEAVQTRRDRGMTEEEAFVISAHELGIGYRASSATDLEPERHRARCPWWAYLLATLGCVLVLFLVECFIVVSKSEYKASSVFEIRPRDERVRFSFSDKQEASGRLDKVDVMTEISIVRSQATLYDVVDRLKLDEKWTLSRQWAYKKLAAGLTLRCLGFEDFSHSRMVSVSFQGADSRLTADIANAVVDAYSTRKKKLRQTELSLVADILHLEIKDQTDKVGRSSSANVRPGRSLSSHA